MANRIAVTLLALLFTCCSLQQKGPSTEHAEKKTVTDPRSISEILGLSDTNTPVKTGTWTLENGGESLVCRLWFFENAKRSIDIQYYSFAADLTGQIACDYLVHAADRGVKVRILIDDAASKMNGRELRLLNSHQNIEIRIYNTGLKLGRPDRKVIKLAENSGRLLKRMHNKLVLIDQEFAITGGRNIADGYFDYHKKYNFRDRDILFNGQAVQTAAASFEKFWNDPLIVTCEEQYKTEEPKAPDRFDGIHHDAEQTLSPTMKQRIKDFPELLRIAKQKNEFIWVQQLSYVSDEPKKRRDQEGSICTDSLMSLFARAKKTIDIQTPYLIITDRGKNLLREATQRGVKIRILTNSLASIDNIEAFSAYQKCREEILKAGVLLYEFKPDAQIRYKTMIPEVQEKLNYKPVYGFHSKSMVIDESISVIGSYNFDPRSADYNTECISIIRSPELAKHLLKYMEEEFLPENAWQTTRSYNPDKEAGVKRRVQAFGNRVFPKKLL